MEIRNKRFSTSHRNASAKSSIKGLAPGDYFRGEVRVIRRAQPGPVILTVSDGYGSIEAVSKECSLDAGNTALIEGFVEERAGKLQVEIKRVSKSSKDFNSVIEQNSIPPKRRASVESEDYKILQQHMERVAGKIRRACLEGIPILIRHHADADGIMAGMAIEKACRLLMEDINIEPSYNLHRSPSKAPFYEFMDVLRDISFTKRFLEEHGQPKPLIIVLDNGSTPEDSLAMKSLSSLGFKVIVIDHHNPVVLKDGKTSVCPFLYDHINPYMHGMDGRLTAGMLAYETARLISEKFEQPVMPAISAIGDRSSAKEAGLYISASGKSVDELKRMVIAIDFLAYSLKFDSGDGTYDEVFSNPGFVRVLNDEVNKGVRTQLQSTLPYLRTREINGVVLSNIDLEKYMLRFTYPTPGKVIGMIHDEVAAGKELPVITLGHLSDMIILRASKPVLPLARIIEKLKKDLPEANVDGGGHECAGAIKFVSAHLSTVLENIKQQVSKIEAESI